MVQVVFLFLFFHFSLVLKLYAKWGQLVSHNFLCVCSLIQIFFLMFSYFPMILFQTQRCQFLFWYLIFTSLPGSFPCAAAWECTWEKSSCDLGVGLPPCCGVWSSRVSSLDSMYMFCPWIPVLGSSTAGFVFDSLPLAWL